MFGLFEKEEKRVEYIELIYDLIFVYIIGRSNSLLHAVENGFIAGDVYLTYILSTLVILQIWYNTTLFVNRYGGNDAAQYIGIFINMYLLYYMADGTRVQWQEFYYRYNVAWGLILLNLAVQYYLKFRASKGLMPWEDTHIRFHLRTLLIEAAIVFISLPLYAATGIPFSPLAMVFGIVMDFAGQRTNILVPVDFPHLSERVMLYVVFTFGEMIIGIAEYFEGGVTVTNVYFSLMAFLIVAGLFLSYGYLYDHIIDREIQTTGTGYMILHIFLIAALNNITTALEFMREPTVDAISKNIFLVGSFLVYFVFLCLLGRFSKLPSPETRRYFRRLLPLFAAFIAAMALCYRLPALSIVLTVLFIFAVYGILRVYGKRLEGVS